MLKARYVWNTVKEWMDSVGWVARFERLESYISVMVSSRKQGGTTFRLVVDTSVAGFLLIYVIYPHKVKPETIDKMSKIIAEINYGIVNGNFELNTKNGEIRYKICISYIGLDSLPHDLLRDSVFRACKMMEINSEIFLKETIHV